MQLSEAFVIPLHLSFFFSGVSTVQYAYPNSTFNENPKLKEKVRLWVQQYNYPDLPSWLRFKQCYNCEYAYLYGTPAKTGLFRLQFIVQLVANSSSNVVTLRLRVHTRNRVACNYVQVKLWNVDVEDLLDSRLDALLNIFRKQLWPLETNQIKTLPKKSHLKLFESISSAYIKSKKSPPSQGFLENHSFIQHLDSGQKPVYLSSILSTVDAGLRLPLDPTHKLGVVLRIGGVGPFSDQLLQLHRELGPIRQSRQCPANYRSSSTEHLFRAKKFLVDWCHFDLIAGQCSPEENTTTMKTVNSRIMLWNETEWLLSHKIRQEIDQKTLVWPDQRRYQPLIALNLAVACLLALVLLIILICTSCN